MVLRIVMLFRLKEENPDWFNPIKDEVAKPVRYKVRYIDMIIAIKSEYALSIAPTSLGITLFTDSLSSIQLINYKKVPRNNLEADFLLCISNLLELRSNDFQAVSFHHVYSHLQKKTQRLQPS